MQHKYKALICSFVIDGYLTQWKQNLNTTKVTCYKGQGVRIVRYVGLYYNTSNSIGPTIKNSQRYDIWVATGDFALRREVFR
jgi:hypothetical protein